MGGFAEYKDIVCLKYYQKTARHAAISDSRLILLLRDFPGRASQTYLSSARDMASTNFSFFIIHSS